MKNSKKIKVILKIFAIVIPIILVSICISFFTSTNKVEVNDKVNEATSEENTENNKVISEEEVRIKPKSVSFSVPIFMYHFIRDNTGNYEYPENMVRPSTLREQLQAIKDGGYEPIFVTDLANIEDYEKPVILTFDDGFEDFYDNAFPLFKEFNMKASLYMITGYTTKTGYCNDKQLLEMQESGLINIEAHTVTHPRLATLSVQQINEELKGSKEYLKNLGIDSKVICYPYGSYNAQVIQASKNLGFEYGLAMDGGVYYSNIHTNIYEIPRIYANRSMSIATYKNYLAKSNVNVTW